MKMLKLTTIIFIIFYGVSIHLNANTNVWEGVEFPTFKLQDQNGHFISKNDYRGKWMVIYFYPKDRTPGCTIEANNFKNDTAKYQALGVSIVGVSYDDVESHKDFAEINELNFTLLADVDKSLSKALKVDRILPWPHPSRETFIVNSEGIIVKHYKDVVPKTHSNQLLQDLNSLIAKK